jgi:hypothetical protein
MVSISSLVTVTCQHCQLVKLVALVSSKLEHVSDKFMVGPAARHAAAVPEFSEQEISPKVMNVAR